MELDLKDRKILYQLDLNARQSNAQIGKKVGLSKQTTGYRIKKLENEGIIKNYYTFIDGIKLGNIVVRLYITFQYMTPNIQNEIIEYFVNRKSAVVVYSLQGRYDFEVVIWLKDQNSYYKFWQETLEKYGDYFQDQSLSLYIQYRIYKLSYLLTDYKKIDHEKYIDFMGGKKSEDIDALDIKILKILSLNARMPLITIGDKVNMSPEGVKYRINRLIKLKIIKSFRVDIDHSKLGYHYYKLDLFLKDYSKRKNIIEYISKNPYLYAIDVTTGSSHLELEFIVKNFEMLNSIMDEINQKFQKTLRNYQYLIFKNTHKFSFFIN